MNLLLQDYLKYNNLYIFSTTLYQPLYQILISGLKNGLNKKKISECILKHKFTVNKNENSSIQVHCFDSEIDSNLKTLIIFDDIMLQKQNKVENYYNRSYIKLSKNTIRENANLLFFHKICKKKNLINYFVRFQHLSVCICYNLFIKRKKKSSSL